MFLDGFEYIPHLGASLLVDATGRLFRDDDYIHRPFAAAYSKSKVNALLSLSKPTTSQREDLEYESEDEEPEGKDFGPRAEVNVELGGTLRDLQHGTDVSNPQTKRGASHLVQDSGADARQVSVILQEPYSERSVNSINTRALRRIELSGQPLLTLEHLVSFMSIFDVTKPHDSIYELLGISKDAISTAAKKRLQVADYTQGLLEMFTAQKRYPIDYSSSYVDICREFIQFCVRTNLSHDPSHALDVICRPWAIDIDIGEEEGDVPFPTWLPRLSKASYGMDERPGITGLSMSRRNADSLVGNPNANYRIYDAAATKGPDKATFRFRRRVAVHQHRSPLFMSHSSLYLKGFVLDTIQTLLPASQSGSIPTIWARFAGWEDLDGTPPDYFWQTLVAGRGTSGKKPPVYYSRACQESFRRGNSGSGVVDTTGLIEHERHSVVAQFSRRVQAAIYNRALMRTVNGRFGLVASDVQWATMSAFSTAAAFQ